MVYLETQLARPGDVLLSLGSAPSSMAIAIATKGKYSHAALCIAKKVFFEALKDGVYATPLKFACFTDKNGEHKFGLHLPKVKRAVLLRHESISERFATESYFGVADDFLAVAAKYVGQPYAKLGRLLCPLLTGNPFQPIGRAYEAMLKRGSLPAKTRGKFCSELIVAIYDDLGIPLFSTRVSAASVNPNMLCTSPFLKEVPDAVLEGKPGKCTEEEIRVIKSAGKSATTRKLQAETNRHIRKSERINQKKLDRLNELRRKIFE